MKQYNRIMLGKGGMYIDECVQGGYIGADYGIYEDLSANLPDNWKDFNTKYIPVYLSANPTKTKVAAGLACGMLWTICKGLNIDDIVLSPNGNGEYYVGVIMGNYYYVPNTVLPHRRKVNWLSQKIARADMSVDLQHSTGSIGTCCAISQYATEIESLLKVNMDTIVCPNPDVEDVAEFAMEKHLEDFLIKNWKNTPLGSKYNIYEVDGEIVGEQFPSDTGPIDILAISKDKKTLLVIELKKGRTSDVVVGQIQRYMGYVKEELAESNQTVKGVIIGLDSDTRLKRALSVTNNIEFYRYQIDFKLVK
ncbi:MAG: endonuclease NucS [Alistipes sp.]